MTKESNVSNESINAVTGGEQADIQESEAHCQVRYVGFWSRFLASIVDSVILMLISWPLLLVLYGKEYFELEQLVAGPADFLISWVFPIVAVVCFWIYKQATPGKMMVAAKIVDAKTGENPTKGQCIIRYFGYFLSIIPFCLGLFAIGWDKKKQGWHDKLAGTVVIKKY